MPPSLILDAILTVLLTLIMAIGFKVASRHYDRCFRGEPVSVPSFANRYLRRSRLFDDIAKGVSILGAVVAIVLGCLYLFHTQVL